MKKKEREREREMEEEEEQRLMAKKREEVPQNDHLRLLDEGREKERRDRRRGRSVF